MKHGICDILRERMVAYVEPRDESVRWLSQRIGLPYSSVYRIISKEAHSCTFRNAYQILKVVAPDEAKAILVEYFPTFAPLIEQDKNFIENEEKLDKALALALQNKMLYVVHSMASTTLGTTRSEVKETYGKAGTEALDVLLEQEILVERRDGIIKDLLFEACQLNGEHLRQMIRYNLESFNSGEISGIFNVVEGYSAAGIEQIRKIFRSTYDQILNLKKDQENLGKLRLFSSMVCGEFDTQVTKGEGVAK